MRKHGLFRIIFIIILSILLAIILRGDILRGTDSHAYISFFNKITDYSSIYGIYYMNDYLFSNLSYLIHILFNDGYIYLFVLFVLSSIILFFSYFQFLNNSNNSIFYVAILLLLFASSYYLLNLNGVRQGLSSSIILLAFSFLYKNEIKKCLFLLIIALLIHKTAIVAILVYFLFFRIKRPIVFFYTSIIFGLILGKYLIYIFQYINFDLLVHKLNSLSRASSGSTSVYFKLIVLTVLINYFYFLSFFIKNKLYSFILKFYILYAGIVFVFLQFEMFVNRLLLIFGLIEPLLFILTIYTVKQKKIMYLLIISMGLLYLAYILNHPSFRSELKLN